MKKVIMKNEIKRLILEELKNLSEQDEAPRPEDFEEPSEEEAEEEEAEEETEEESEETPTEERPKGSEYNPYVFDISRAEAGERGNMKFFIDRTSRVAITKDDSVFDVSKPRGERNVTGDEYYIRFENPTSEASGKTSDADGSYDFIEAELLVDFTPGEEETPEVPGETPEVPELSSTDPGLQPPAPAGAKVVDRGDQGDKQYIYVLNQDFSVTAYRRGEMRDGKMAYYPQLKKLTTFAKGSEAAQTIARAAGFDPMATGTGGDVDAEDTGLSSETAALINQRNVLSDRLAALRAKKPVVANNLDNELKGLKLGKDMQAREKMKELETQIANLESEMGLSESLINEGVYNRWQTLIKN